MRKHKRKKRNTGDVELNLAAMLDMAFQLLTFFILTFRPAPVEGDVMLRMPPPLPTVKVDNAQKLGSDPNNTNPVQALNTLIITAEGSAGGRLKQLFVGESPVMGLNGLDAKLKQVLGDSSTGFEQVLIQVGSSLHYDELMQVVDVCTRQKMANGEKLKKLSMVEMPSGG